jgi:HPt (histidine-containing phosphotransfer) domain-containing protein
MTDTHGTGEAGSDLDLDAIRELARKCGWTFGEFVEFYLSGTGRQIDSLGERITAGDTEEVVRLAHRGVGSSSTAGVDSMAELFREIEMAAGAGHLEEAASALERVRWRFADVGAILNDALPS